KRPPSAESVADMLRQMEKQAGAVAAGATPVNISATPRPLWQRLLRPWLLGSCAIGLVALVIVFFLWRRTTPSPEAPGPDRTSAAAPALAKAPFDAKEAKEHQDAWAKYLDVKVLDSNSIG